MEDRAKVLENITQELFNTLGAIVKFEEVRTANGHITYETQDLSKLTGILGGTLIKRAWLSACVSAQPLKDGTYYWSIDWRFDFGSGSNGNDFVRIWTNNDGVDSAKGENKIMGFKSIINEYYARDIIKKIRSSIRTIAEKGQFIGCNAPYGYRLDPDDRHHLLPDDTTAPIVKEMFAWAAQGISCNPIALRLSDRDILTPRAYVAHTLGKYKEFYNHDFPKEWNISCVLNILKNREYCGHMVSQKETTK